MIVNENYNFAFIHIPKTGGNTILRPFFGSCPDGKDVNADELRSVVWGFKHNHHIPNPWEVKNERAAGRLVFASVRHPVDRAISLFFWRKWMGANDGMMFEDFVDRFIVKEKPVPPADGDVLVLSRSQSEYIAPGVDLLVRLENLQEDMNLVCDKLDIPHMDYGHRFNHNPLRENIEVSDEYRIKILRSDELVSRTVYGELL